MDVWTDERVGGWCMDRWVDGRVCPWVDGCIGESVDGWVGGRWIDGQTDRRVTEWVAGWLDGVRMVDGRRGRWVGRQWMGGG